MKEYEALDNFCRILFRWLKLMSEKLSKLSKEDNLDLYWMLSKKWDHYYAIYQHLHKVRHKLILKERSVRVQTPQEIKKEDKPV
jgi:hypothetical protein